MRLDELIDVVVGAVCLRGDAHSSPRTTYWWSCCGVSASTGVGIGFPLERWSLERRSARFAGAGTARRSDAHCPAARACVRAFGAGAGRGSVCARGPRGFLISNLNLQPPEVHVCDVELLEQTSSFYPSWARQPPPWRHRRRSVGRRAYRQAAGRPTRLGTRATSLSLVPKEGLNA
jgi:hypothetical protein